MEGLKIIYLFLLKDQMLPSYMHRSIQGLPICKLDIGGFELYE